MSVKFCEVNNTSLANQSKNKTLKKKYDANPRCFWNDPEVRDTFPSFLVSTAIFICSILAASANCERAFSRMGWMVAARRTAITANNADKRLTLCNQLPPSVDF